MREGLWNFVVNFMAFKKPWLYLSICCGVVMWVLVWFGNPLLPIPSLASYGVAWHHIPEWLGFFFFGIWCGSWRFLSSRKLTCLDLLSLIPLIAVSVVQPSVYFSTLESFLIIVNVVTIPSFCGYIVMRLYKILKAELKPTHSKGTDKK